MKNFKIAMVQHKSIVGKKAANIENIIKLVKKTVKTDNDVKLILFPELAITGHVGHSSMISEAEEIPNGNAVSAIAKLAKDEKIYICVGMAEIESGVHYNTMFLVGPDGYIGKQRKIHLSGDEYFYFRGGSSIQTFDLGFVKTGIIVCYDNMHPEIARVMALRGTELILAPYASRLPAKGNPSFTEDEIKANIDAYKEGWRVVQRARAGDNNLYVALTNISGVSAPHVTDKSSLHLGGCMLINPYAQIIAESKTTSLEDEIVISEVRAEFIEARHNEECNPLRTRKPELFSEIAAKTE